MWYVSPKTEFAREALRVLSLAAALTAGIGLFWAPSIFSAAPRSLNPKAIDNDWSAEQRESEQLTKDVDSMIDEAGEALRPGIEQVRQQVYSVHRQIMGLAKEPIENVPQRVARLRDQLRSIQNQLTALVHQASGPLKKHLETARKRAAQLEQHLTKSAEIHAKTGWYRPTSLWLKPADCELSSEILSVRRANQLNCRALGEVFVTGTQGALRGISFV